jgi:hypothetical protein
MISAISDEMASTGHRCYWLQSVEEGRPDDLPTPRSTALTSFRDAFSPRMLCKMPQYGFPDTPCAV